MRRLLLIGLGCGLVLAADAAQVRIPALAGGKASIQLVDAADRKTPVLGFVGPEWATTYSGLLLDTAKTVELTATADIATAGASTCYKVTVAASGGRGYDACVTVPPGSATHDLRTLAGAAVVPPASLLAGSLLPSTAGAAPGWGLVLADDLSVAWGALVAGGGGGGGGTWGSITGTLAAQLDLATALAGLAPLSHTQAATTITGLAPVATGGAYADLTGRPTLGTAAASAATDFATAAQGALAASASQPGHTQAWGTLTATPTTRAGYGITDAAPLWMSVSTATGVGSATVDLSTTVEVYQMALTASGVLTIVQPTSGYRTVRLDVTSDTGARSWLISSIIAPSWARGIADDMTPPTGTGVVRSYWITGTPTTLSMSALTSWVPQ